MIMQHLFKMAAVPAEMSEADLEEFSKMFPGVEKTVIKVNKNIIQNTKKDKIPIQDRRK